MPAEDAKRLIDKIILDRNKVIIGSRFTEGGGV